MNNLFLENEIKELIKKGLKRTLKTVSSPQSRRITIDGRELINFCSNNYLGLADDARLSDAAMEVMKTQGFGSGASRLVCGNMKAHQDLEERIAQFKKKPSCLVFSTGYMANIGILSSLFDREDIIFSDKLNHASIVDGILLSKATFKRYAHCDMQALENLLESNPGYKRRAIVTDSVFSMDGDVAPLNRIVDLAKKHKCLVMIDEAHGFGVLGQNGRGAVEHFGVEDQIDIQMGTLSKAAGSFGAYCVGDEELISYLINKARSFIYTTGMPASTAAASIKAIDIIENEKHLRETLWKNTRYIREKLQSLGFSIGTGQTPIIPIIIGDNDKTLEFSQKLFEAGIFISAIRPPTVPVNTARLRLTVMATHTKVDMDKCLNQFESIGKSLCLI